MMSGYYVMVTQSNIYELSSCLCLCRLIWSLTGDFVLMCRYIACLFISAEEHKLYGAYKQIGVERVRIDLPF